MFTKSIGFPVLLPQEYILPSTNAVFDVPIYAKCGSLSIFQSAVETAATPILEFVKDFRFSNIMQIAYGFYSKGCPREIYDGFHAGSKMQLLLVQEQICGLLERSSLVGDSSSHPLENEDHRLKSVLWIVVTAIVLLTLGGFGWFAWKRWSAATPLREAPSTTEAPTHPVATPPVPAPIRPFSPPSPPSPGLMIGGQAASPPGGYQLNPRGSMRPPGM
eukprot:Gregarina_sp_Poly_1__2830@NODE_178_length_11948_cov_356_078613_g158_i0_p6_GENE_NODE_178_length_11948_cov_356_078613_g158_i0NODE_178_length_11948_cov_356_078613_g158_i0_p6_ORF_typecomplete_len218_score21_27PAP_PilO/PF06864_12/0_0095DctQ/PF04290_12/0_077DUF4381/PF14316_6/0_15DUF4307/PF14155_6/0_26TPR_21/PF09976_9/0_3_NODE_178_length_11948_cov_356_078613_g158_i01060011253